MKLTKAIILMTILVGSALSSAEPLPSAPGLWERFCINSRIGDACRHAVNSLSRKISSAENEQAIEFQRRLQTMAAMGCKLNNNFCCERMKDTTIESLKADFLVQQDTDH